MTSFSHRAAATTAFSILVTSTFVLAGPASAAVDNFDYAGGSIAGNDGGSASGGIAFTSPYSIGEGAVSVIAGFGGIGSASGAASADPYVEAGSGYSQAAARSVTPQTNTVSYLSGLISIGRGADGSLGDSFGGFGLYEGGTEKFLVGQRFGASNFGVATSAGGGNDGDSASPIGDFDVALLVSRLDQVNNTLSLYVNPDLSMTEAVAVPDFVRTYDAAFDDDYDAIRLRGGSSDGTFQFDNLSVSQTSPFAAVPEPASFALLAAGFGLLGCRRGSRA